MTPETISEDIEIYVSSGIAYSELKQSVEFKDGKMISYGYSIQFDKHGVEVSRTDHKILSVLRWDDGSEFTKKDVDGLIGWRKYLWNYLG